MHRSSESIGTIAGALAKAQAELSNPEKSLDRDHPVAVSKGGRPDVPLRLALERARYRPQGAGQARDRDRADHGDRRGGAYPADHGARPFVWGVGLVRLAGVPGQRDVGAPSDGRGPDLCHGAMRCSPWSGLPGRMTLMRRISGAAPKASSDQPSPPNGQKLNGHALSDAGPAPAAPRRRAPPARPAKPVLRPRSVGSVAGSAGRRTLRPSIRRRGGQLGPSEPARQEHADGRRCRTCRSRLPGKACCFRR